MDVAMTGLGDCSKMLTRDISFVKMIHDQVGWAPRDHSGGTLPVG